MKKLLLVSMLVIVAGSLAIGQNAYRKGNKLVHGGLGFGLAGIYGDASLPPITVGYEHGLEEKISLGGIVGFAGSSQDFIGGEWSYTYILIGARGAYHFLENNSQWDAYGGLVLGYNIVSTSWDGPGVQFGSASGSYLLWGLYGGGRYYFNPRWAVYGEIGYGAGILAIGVAHKL